ncbi:hypothetical protein CapIbe_011099 [Capra ibex]
MPNDVMAHPLFIHLPVLLLSSWTILYSVLYIFTAAGVHCAALGNNRIKIQKDGAGAGWGGWGRAGGPNEEPWVRTALPADVAHPVVAGPLRQWGDIVPRGVTVKVVTRAEE